MEINGLKWPDEDNHCYQVAFDTTGLDVALTHCKSLRTAVQAGGNCGAWPKKMSKIFDTVYTFEPHCTNFRYLVENVPEENVVKMQAALGCEGDLVHMNLADDQTGNMGAFHVKPGGIIPTISIDDLGLKDVDLIYLDIEGSEYFALLGATRTILKYRPVIGLEMNGLATRYGHEEDDILKWLNGIGYKMVGSYWNDRIFV